MSHACYPSLGETEAGRLREFEDNLTTEYIFIFKKNKIRQGVVAHTFNSSPWEAEVGGSL